MTDSAPTPDPGTQRDREEIIRVLFAGEYNGRTREEIADALLRLRKPAAPTPIPTMLRCPKCALTHVDEGEWATKPHRTHLCAWCGHEWRPYDYPTVGVLFQPAAPDAPTPGPEDDRAADALPEPHEETEQHALDAGSCDLIGQLA